jgi:hypothetical protein
VQSFSDTVRECSLFPAGANGPRWRRELFPTSDGLVSSLSSSRNGEERHESDSDTGHLVRIERCVRLRFCPRAAGRTDATATGDRVYSGWIAPRHPVPDFPCCDLIQEQTGTGQTKATFLANGWTAEVIFQQGWICLAQPAGFRRTY